MIASLVQIDWYKSSTGYIVPGTKFSGVNLKVTDKKHRHFLELKWCEARNGIKYPRIQFFSHIDGTQYWNGYESLIELFEREGGQVLSDIDRDRLQRKRLEQEVELKAKQEQAQRQLHIKDKHSEKNRNNYKVRWKKGEFNPELVAKHSYLIKKGIPASVIAAGLDQDNDHKIALVSGREFYKDSRGRWVKNWRSWLAIPMFDFLGRYVGQQRIYTDIYAKTQGKKGLKAHAPGTKRTNGGHFIIGNPLTAGQVEYVEGFATGATIYKAAIAERKGTDIAIIVCFDKNGLAKVVKHFKQKWTSKRHIIRADNDHFKWLEGKGNAGLQAALELQKELGVQVTYPIFENISTDTLPTDFNDLEVLAGHKATSQQLWGRQVNRLKADSNLFQYHLQSLRLAGQLSWSNKAKKAAQAGAFLVPNNFDRKTVIDAIFRAIPNQIKCKHGEKKTIAHHLSWLVNRRFQDAAATKNFSPDVLKQDNINYIKVKAAISPAGYPIIPDNVIDMVRGLKGPTILKSVHASGKTEQVMGPLMREAKGGAAMIVHRVTLANQMANELSLSHYKEIDGTTIWWDTRLVTCVNSIIHDKFKGFFEDAELLCVDEATQVLRHTMGGKDAIHAPVRAYNKLLAAARSAKNVLLADADANDSLIEFLQQARPGQMINVIHVESPPIDMTIKYCDNVEFVYHKILEAAKQTDQRLLIATDNKGKAAALQEGIKQQRPNAKILCVTADSKGNSNELAFSNDPNGEAAKYDVLIYSPVISSGVSIKNLAASFDAHFGLFHGVVVPSDILQMLRRDRNAKQFLIGFKPNHENRQTDRDAMVRGLMAAYETSQNAMKWTLDETRLAVEKTPFDEMYLDIKIQEAKSRNDYSSHTLMLMAAEGWKLERVAVDNTDASIGSMELDANKDLVRSQHHDLMESADTPNDKVYQKLKRRELITQAESAEIKRWEIENQLGVDVTPDSIDFFDAQGLTKLRRLELLQANQSEVEQIEAWEHDQKVSFTQRRLSLPRNQRLTWVFDALGLDPHTFLGQFDITKARKVFEYFTSSTAAIDEYNALRIGPLISALEGQKPTCPTRFVKGILERFVPVINGKKVQGVQFYQLHPGKFAELNSYIKSRQKIGQNHLIIDENSEYFDDNREAAMAMKVTETPSLLACKQGGESIEGYIYNSSGISPQQKHLMLSMIEHDNFQSLLPELLKPCGDTQGGNILDTVFINLLTMAQDWVAPKSQGDTQMVNS